MDQESQSATYDEHLEGAGAQPVSQPDKIQAPPPAPPKPAASVGTLAEFDARVKAALDKSTYDPSKPLSHLNGPPIIPTLPIKRILLGHGDRGQAQTIDIARQTPANLLADLRLPLDNSQLIVNAEGVAIDMNCPVYDHIRMGEKVQIVSNPAV